MKDIPSPIARLQEMLLRRASAETKAWFENYLKGAIHYYGVKSPVVAQIVQAWYAQEQLAQMPFAAQMQLVDALMALPHAEEKFAACIYMQRYLIEHVPTEQLTDTVASYYQRGYVFDWSTADWLTMRVLAPLVKKDARVITTMHMWARAENLWQRRASIISLRSVVKQRKHIPDIQQIITVLVDDSARFIQTGIGWTLSDLSRAYPEDAAAIVEQHFDKLSKEVITRHTKYLPQHKEYIHRAKHRT